MKIPVYSSSFSALYKRIQFLENRLNEVGLQHIRAQHETFLLNEENANLCAEVKHLRSIMRDIESGLDRVCDVINAYEISRLPAEEELPDEETV